MKDKEEFNLDEYLAKGVEHIVKDIAKSVFKNPRGVSFMAEFAGACMTATKKRHAIELKGEHIPPFLIASITHSCNLHCEGCYARANKECFDDGVVEHKILDVQEWDTLFTEAEELGISFILLAGGEPMLRADVLNAAGRHRKILFPVFTNGTLMSEGLIGLFVSNQNLVPVISVEGDASETDNRRGNGVYEKIEASMKELHSRGISFGASITVTKTNMDEVFSSSFVHDLQSKGCKAIIYVEYVPVDEYTRQIALDDCDREIMKQRLNILRREQDGMLLISFPGDEKSSGGCLAAGRGFFHINAFGSAEPCPFSAYSDTDIRETGIRKALKSPLFRALNEKGIMDVDHIGGCVLFEKKEIVEALCKGEAK